MSTLTQTILNWGAIATAAVAIAEVIRRGVNHLKAFVAAQVAVPLAAIRAEFSPDHGESMKDATNRIEEQITALQKQVREHTADMLLHTPNRRATDRRDNP